MDRFCGSPFWDSNLTWNTEDPDFTPCFLQTALVYAPCIFLVICLPLDFYFTLTNKYANIPWSWNNSLRLIFNGLLIVLSVTDLVMAATWPNPDELFDVHFVTPSVKIITFLIAGGMIFIHRRRGIRSSGMLCLFWLVLLVLAIPQFRHEIRQNEQLNVTGDGTDDYMHSWSGYQMISHFVFFGLVLVQLVLHFFNDAEPRESQYAHLKQTNPSPELHAGFFNRILFLYCETLTWKGFRRPLVAGDLWDIQPENTSKSMTPVFDLHWHNNVQKNERAAMRKNKKIAPTSTDAKETHGNIVPVLFRTFAPEFCLGALLKLCIDLLSFAPPQILGLIVTFTVVLDIPMWHGVVYTLTLLFISLLTAMLNGQHAHYSYLTGYRIRTVMISAIYRKSLRLSNAARRGRSVGEVVNLMSVDAQRFVELVPYLHMAWAAPLVIAISVYFLYQVVGVAAFAGLAVMVVMVPISGYISSKMRSLQAKQMVHKDERMKSMNEILNGIRVLKLYAWESSFDASVNRVREKELVVLRQAAIANVLIYVQFSMIPFMIILTTFLMFMFVDPVNNQIDANTYFVALSLLFLMRTPMTMFPMVLAQVMSAWVSVKRLNSFLNSGERDDTAISYAKDADALKIKDATFIWSSDGEDNANGKAETIAAVLKNVNLTVEKGSLAAVVGPVGCGKSSLIFSLLGDTQKVRGAVNVDGTVAYVAQQAWIQNATLQDNILFGRPMERGFYDRVIEACALTTDLQMLPGGDQTEIGEKGINLSGGQKQRVALARAVYARSDIYLLDDPLSAVDSHVGKHIFENVIGPNGLLVGKTRLLVTHGISFLPQTDNIFVLSNGAISEHGSYGELVEQKGAFAEFLEQHLQNVDQDDVDELEAIKSTLVNSTTGAKLFERAISEQSSKSGKRKSLTEDIPKKMEAVTTNDGTKLIGVEESAVGGIGWAVYVNYFGGIGLLVCSWFVGSSAVFQGLSVYSSLWLSEWSAHPDANEPAVRDLYLGVYGGLSLLTAVFMFISSVSMAFGCLNAARKIHAKLLQQTLRLPMAFFDTTPVGRIMNRFTKDIDTLDNTLPQVIRAWMVMFMGSIGIMVVISMSTPIFIAVIVPLGIFYYFIQRFYVATTRQLKRIESVTRSPIYSHFGETLAGQTTIRAYGEQERFRLTSERHVDYNQQCYYPYMVVARWLGIRLELIGALVLLFASLFAVLARGNIESNLVGLSITYALQITATLSFLVRLTAELETHIVSNERLAEYTAVPTEAALETDRKVATGWPLDGVVKFDDLQLRYREGLELVLRGITFEIRGGEKIGIVGRTGAGKSSLTLALFRLIESASGTISIDGVPIDELGLHTLRKRLTIIPQDPVLFSGTLRMNVDPFDVYSDTDIWTALEHAHLKAFVGGTQSGLEYEIAENGENLSIGQRQLVCLARALLRKTKVLILDEATAAIDLETDELIQATIREQFKDCTVLTIAHRLNTILDSDRVLVLDKGLVAELDTPGNLLADRQSLFYGMAKDAGLVRV